MTTQEFISSLFEIRINAHIAHLQTDSYSQHIALDELYNGIVGHTDAYVENEQGIRGVVRGYPQIKLRESKDIVPYLKLKIIAFREYRFTIQEPELQQLFDNIIEFLNGIIYKLVNLS
jgi:hypothetical protein